MLQTPIKLLRLHACSAAPAATLQNALSGTCDVHRSSAPLLLKQLSANKLPTAAPQGTIAMKTAVKQSGVLVAPPAAARFTTASDAFANQLVLAGQCYWPAYNSCSTPFSSCTNSSAADLQGRNGGGLGDCNMQTFACLCCH